MCGLSEHGRETNAPVQEVDLINFPPGSVIAFKKVHLLSIMLFSVFGSILLLASGMYELSEHGGETNAPVQEVDLINFPPGSVIAFK